MNDSVSSKLPGYDHLYRERWLNDIKIVIKNGLVFRSNLVEFDKLIIAGLGKNGILKVDPARFARGRAEVRD